MVRKKKILQVEGKVREIHSKLGKKKKCFSEWLGRSEFFYQLKYFNSFFL